MSKVLGNCWKCGQELTEGDYGRQATCPKCGFDVKVCMNCQFHDRAYNNECRETQADRVVEKEKSNFCDYFKPKNAFSGDDPAAEARKAAEALFKK